MPVLTILDDYQQVARSSADWSAVAERYEIEALHHHLDGEDRVVERLARSEVVVAMRERTPFPAGTLERLPALRLLVTTGMVNAAVDLAAADRLGITVCGTRGSSTAVPELTMGMVIALTRNFVAEDRAVRAGGWQHTIGPGLAGHTMGVVGLGRIGTPVAALARAFAMDVIAWSPHLTAARAEAGGATAVPKEALFERADVVTVHLPLVDATRGLIGAADLDRMGRGAYLVNTSRGPIVDEGALVDALAGGRIAGAALDVFDTEPLPADHPLRTLPNTLLLPHVGYVTTDGYRIFYGEAVEDVLAFAEGRPVRVLR